MTVSIHTNAPKPHESFFDAVLRDGDPMTHQLLDEGKAPSLMRKMLGLSVASFGAYGLAVGFVGQFLPHAAPPTGAPPVVWVPIALVTSFLVAIAVGLPSFYFYTQLAGLDASFRLITAQALRVHARTSVFLLGIMPFYLALALFDYASNGQLDPLTFFVGLVIPFFCGLFGLRSLYKSFRTLVKMLPITHERRGNVLMRLVFCWAAFAATVAPVAMWRISMLLTAQG